MSGILNPGQYADLFPLSGPHVHPYGPTLEPIAPVVYPLPPVTSSPVLAPGPDDELAALTVVPWVPVAAGPTDQPVPAPVPVVLLGLGLVGWAVRYGRGRR